MCLVGAVGRGQIFQLIHDAPGLGFNPAVMQSRNVGFGCPFSDRSASSFHTAFGHSQVSFTITEKTTTAIVGPCVVAVLKRRANMIRQPEWGTRNVNKYFYESEARRIAELNEIFGDIELTEAEMRMLIWLAGWDEYTIENVLSAIRKAIAAEVKRRHQPPRP